MIQQGHRYSGPHGRSYIAASAPNRVGLVDAIPINPASPCGFDAPTRVHALALTPEPMRYFHGEAPK